MHNNSDSGNNNSGNNNSGNNNSGNNAFPSLLAEALEINLLGAQLEKFTKEGTRISAGRNEKRCPDGTWEEFLQTVPKPEKAKESTWSSLWFTDLTKALWMFENELDVERHGHQKQGLFEALLNKLEVLLREANGTAGWLAKAEEVACGDRAGCYVKGVTSLVTMVGFLDKAHIEQVDGDVYMLAIPTTHSGYTSVGDLTELSKRGLLNRQNNRWVTAVRFEGEGMQGYSVVMKPLPTRVCWVKASAEKGVFTWHPGPRNMGDVPYVRLGANPGIPTVINGRVCVM
jgi:hypothetical protein